jgi:hypothetical protein
MKGQGHVPHRRLQFRISTAFLACSLVSLMFAAVTGRIHGEGGDSVSSVALFMTPALAVLAAIVALIQLPFVTHGRLQLAGEVVAAIGVLYFVSNFIIRF